MLTESTRLLSTGLDKNVNENVNKGNNNENSYVSKKTVGLVSLALMVVIGLFVFGNGFTKESFSLFSKNSIEHNNNEIDNNDNDNDGSVSVSDNNNDVPPNIIYIMMDDMGFSDISARGAEFVTPKLDELYENSIVLDYHYIGLVCSPTRSQMITGRYAWNMGLSEQSAFGDAQLKTLPSGIPTLGNLLQYYTEYSTYWVGKWHMGYTTEYHTPLHRGFEKFYGFYSSNLDYNDKTVKTMVFEKDYIDWRKMDEIDYDTQYNYSTFVTGDYAIEVINTHFNEYSNTKPFYLQIPFQAVHPVLDIVSSENDANCESLPMGSRQLVCANIMAVDYVIGNIVTTLKETGVWDNTLIVFTSDNGGNYNEGGCNYPLRGGKEKFFEGGIRTAAFLNGGYIEKIRNNEEGTLIRNEMMHMADWTPTLLSIAGANINDISNDLQEKLYVPLAKTVSKKMHKTEKLYKNYLMEDSFDGKDLSKWILFGETNDIVEVPLSINSFESITVYDYSDNDNNEDNSDDSDDSSDLREDIAIIFTSKYTNNKYKLFLLNDKIGSGIKNSEYCVYGNDDGNDEETAVTDIGNSNNDDDSDSNKKTKYSIKKTKKLFDQYESENNEKAYSIYTKFTKTNKFLFDLSIEPRELTNLMEHYLTNFNEIEVSNEDENEFIKIGSSSDNELDIINDVDDYNEKLISLIWKEGIEASQNYIAKSVLSNDVLSCVESTFAFEANPELFNNALSPFFTFDKYNEEMDFYCKNEMNPVLLQLYQTRFSDYF